MIKKVQNFCAITVLVMFILLLISSLLINSAFAQDSSISGTVRDSDTTDPIENVFVSLSFSQNATGVNTTQTDISGYYQFSELHGNTYTVSFESPGYHDKYEVIALEEGASYELNVLLIEYLYDNDGDGIPDSDEPKQYPGEASYSESSFPICFQTVILVTIALIISLIMYSKIKRENLLKNAIRRRILDHVKENPGKHYRAILSDLDLPMGVLTYHLNRLEKAQYIKSRQDGIFRRFYPPGRKTEMRFFLSEIQESILNVIKENRGISQSKIAEKIGVSRKVVNYHSNILDQAGLIFVESHGRESACYLRGGINPDVSNPS
ncbi:MAG: winged helix-turn-helix transcriptional regulator [Thermoplasmata archaeon]|nr:MAG: winged helix-turn-helix transcriptional regulator [Thermoplasmata archaeon]